MRKLPKFTSLERFALVGGVGFMVDTLIFSVLFHRFGLDLMLARG